LAALAIILGKNSVKTGIVSSALRRTLGQRSYEARRKKYVAYGQSWAKLCLGMQSMLLKPWSSELRMERSGRQEPTKHGFETQLPS
jgi:hypothetical protein